MKYTQFSQLSEMASERGYDVAEIIETPNKLFEAPIQKNKQNPEDNQQPEDATNVDTGGRNAHGATGDQTAQTGAPAAPAAQTGAPAAQTGAPAAQTGAPAAQTGAPATDTGQGDYPAGNDQGVGVEAGPDSAHAIPAMSNGIFGVISAKALLFGVVGVGAAAMVAWILRRQIVKAVWIKKLKNNAVKIGKQIDVILIKNAKPMLLEKDKMIAKGKQINDQRAKTKDQNTIKRLDSLQAQLDKTVTAWETKFIEMIDNSVDTLIDGKTKELYLRIDGLKQLQPAQKVSLKTMWATMMINLKANGYTNLTKLKLVASDEILNKIKNDINTEKNELKKKTDVLKEKLAKKYKETEITVAGVPVKYGEWYTYDEAKNMYVRFIFNADKLGESEDTSYEAQLITTSTDKKTGKLTKTTKGYYQNEDQIAGIIKKANITKDTPTVDLDGKAKEATANQTPEQKAVSEAKAKLAKQKALEEQATLEANGKENDPAVVQKRKELFKKMGGTLLTVAVSVTAATLLKSLF